MIHPFPSAAQHSFNQVPAVKIQRSKFDRSHAHKTTFNAGLLIPVYIDEVLPGDTFNMRASFLARMATPLKPIMDNMYLESFFFFVPNRLLWTHWVNFNGEQANPADSIAYTVPTIPMPVGGPAVGTLYDYFGVPSGAAITGTFNVDNLWGRAYNLIYNTWFRDENQQNSVTVDTGDGPDTYANYVLKRRGKRFDYFTSCLPWPQKGGTAVLLPLGNSATVKFVAHGQSTNPMLVRKAADDTIDTVASGLAATGTGQLEGSAGGNLDFLDPNGRLYADMTTVTAATINALRLAEWTQALLERDARGGTRYTEIVRSHFGVVSPDARLQRPEYLGGGSTVVNQHPVPQTAPLPSAGTLTVQGNLAAFTVANAKGHGFNKSFTEHGVIIGLVCVRAELSYQQGLHRMFSRSTRYDFYWPSLATIGEQAVLNQEIYLIGGAQDTAVFGYQERYGEYRYKPSLITGQFRSTYATPLDMWHLAQNFSALPVLGDTFISETPPMARVEAVASAPDFIMDSWFELTCARPMPVYGIPSLGGRF